MTSKRTPKSGAEALAKKHAAGPKQQAKRKLPAEASPQTTDRKKTSWGRRLAPLIAGLLLILCFPKADLGPLAFVALAPLVSCFPYTRSRDAAGAGFVCGFVFFAGLLYWIALFTHHVIGWLGVVAWLVLAGMQSVFVALFALAANALWGRVAPLARLFVIPSLWTITEWLRGLGSLGMGWGDLAYTQWHFLPLLQVASLAGCWGVTWLLVLVNTALAEPSRKNLLTAVAFVGAALLYGFWVLGRPLPAPTYTASAIQADLNQNINWYGGRPANPADYQGPMQTFGAMIGQASREHGARLCVLPETALPGYLRYDPPMRQQVLSWASADHTAIAAGGHDIVVSSGKDVNALFIISPSGQIAGEYAKQQLVPFGEYVPYQRLLPFLAALHVASFNDEPGPANPPAADAGVPVGRIGAAICYESTYNCFLREQTSRGANVLCVITDDTWFGKTAAARQHLAASALRSVENHRYVVRCAATGISAIFSPTGRLMAQAPLFTRAVVSAPVSSLQGQTLFTRCGDWFIAACLLVVVGVPLARRR